jgi:hypothetical protein
MSISHELIIENLEAITDQCLEELGYPPCSMAFSFSLKNGADKGNVICNKWDNFNRENDFEFTDEKVEAFRELFLSKLW